ncbi:MAG: NAD-dependent epimerase/dehydratase family protein [Gammaproteobacteria bacterium]|jgi:UDP-glucose 4-epimerase|nr:NAD-dependent epimerase/dehydratase family protein [Gammaproteobacteria bacterium]
MKTYCITGVGGYLGRLLANRLAADADARVVGIDIVSGLELTGVTVYQCDIRDAAEVSRILVTEKPDVLLHLAFYTLPEGDAQAAKSINIDGTQNIARAAVDAGVGRFVLVSSAAVYGSHANNPVALTEQHMPRPNDWFYYSHHKAEQERVMTDIVQQTPGAELVILRPAAVIGPHIDNPTGDALRGSVLFYPRGVPAPIQLLDEDDVAEAFYLAATGSRTGIFNVAAAGTLTYPELARLMGKRLMLLPYPVLAALATLGKLLGLVPVGARTVRFIRHPIVLDATEFSHSFNFRPRFDTRSAFMRFVASLAS